MLVPAELWTHSRERTRGLLGQGPYASALHLVAQTARAVPRSGEFFGGERRRPDIGRPGGAKLIRTSDQHGQKGSYTREARDADGGTSRFPTYLLVALAVAPKSQGSLTHARAGAAESDRRARGAGVRAAAGGPGAPRRLRPPGPAGGDGGGSRGGGRLALRDVGWPRCLGPHGRVGDVLRAAGGGTRGRDAKDRGCQIRDGYGPNACALADRAAGTLAFAARRGGVRGRRIPTVYLRGRRALAYWPACGLRGPASNVMRSRIRSGAVACGSQPMSPTRGQPNCRVRTSRCRGAIRPLGIPCLVQQGGLPPARWRLTSAAW